MTDLDIADLAALIGNTGNALGLERAIQAAHRSLRDAEYRQGWETLQAGTSGDVVAQDKLNAMASAVLLLVKFVHAESAAVGPVPS